MNLPSLVIEKNWSQLELEAGKYVLQNKSTANIFLFEGETPIEEDALILYPGRAMTVIMTDIPIHTKSSLGSSRVAVTTIE